VTRTSGIGACRQAAHARPARLARFALLLQLARIHLNKVVFESK